MPIERVINGVIYEFPDGTSEAVIRRFEAQKAGGAPAPAAPAAKRPDAFAPGPVGQALQGLTLGFSDEAIAKLRSMAGQGSYEDLIKAEREGLRKYSEEHPVVSGVAEFGGALAPAILTGGASLAPGAGRALATKVGPRIAEMFTGAKPTIGRMAAAGAGTGAVQAVGTSEKPLSEAPGEALAGGAAGAAAGAGLGIAGKYVVAPAFAKVKSMLGFGDANRMADITIANALAKDGLTPEAAAQRMAAVARGEMTLADLGENTAALLRRATTAPGPARTFAKQELVSREAARVPRVADDLRTLMSASKDFYTDVQDLIKKRSTDAKSLYDAAYSAGPSFNPQTAPGIDQLRNLPSFKEAMKAGQKRMQDLGLDISDPKNTLRALHETKMALDDMIESSMRSGSTNQARTLIDMKNKLLTDMEKASPEYRIARQTYAGDSEMLTAMNEGRNIYTLPEPEMRSLIKRFESSPSEYDAFRAGISQAMLERLKAGGPQVDPFKTVFPRGTEDKIRRAFRDDDAFDQFKTRLLEEGRMLETEKAGFRRRPVDTDIEGAAGAVGAAVNLAAGRPFTAAREALAAAVPNVVGMPTRVAQPVAQRLLTPAPSIDPVIGSIMQSLKAQEADLIQQSATTGTLGALSGMAAGSRGIPQQYPGDQGPAPTAPQIPSGPSGGSPLGSLTQ